MLDVELVGGKFDGLRFAVASRQKGLDVPLAFLFDGDVVTGAEVLRYKDLGRDGEGGRPLYGFSYQFVMIPGVEDRPSWLDDFRLATAELVRARSGRLDGGRLGAREGPRDSDEGG